MAPPRSPWNSPSPPGFPPQTRPIIPSSNIPAFHSTVLLQIPQPSYPSDHATANLRAPPRSHTPSLAKRTKSADVAKMPNFPSQGPNIPWLSRYHGTSMVNSQSMHTPSPRASGMNISTPHTYISSRPPSRLMPMANSSPYDGSTSTKTVVARRAQSTSAPSGQENDGSWVESLEDMSDSDLPEAESLRLDRRDRESYSNMKYSLASPNSLSSSQYHLHQAKFHPVYPPHEEGPASRSSRRTLIEGNYANLSSAQASRWNSRLAPQRAESALFELIVEPFQELAYQRQSPYWIGRNYEDSMISMGSPIVNSAPRPQQQAKPTQAEVLRGFQDLASATAPIQRPLATTQNNAYCGESDTRVICCSNVIFQAPSTKAYGPSPPDFITAKPSRPVAKSQFAVQVFAQRAGGYYPDRHEDSKFAIPWEEYSRIYAVVRESSSTKSHTGNLIYESTNSHTGTFLYAFSHLSEGELIEIPESGFLDVVAEGDEIGIGKDCLVRQSSSSLDYTCPVHLGTIFTIYLLKYVPKNPPPKPPAPRPLDCRGGPKMALMAPPPPPPPRQHPGSNNSPANPRTPTVKKSTTFSSPSTISPPKKKVKTKKNTLGASPLGRFAMAADGTELKTCSAHKKMMPVDRFDVNLKNGLLYGHCRACQGRRR